MEPVILAAIDSSDTSRFAAFGRRPGEDRGYRTNRRRRVSRVRRSLETESYENDLKLSIALDRLLTVIQHS